LSAVVEVSFDPSQLGFLNVESVAPRASEHIDSFLERSLSIVRKQWHHPGVRRKRQDETEDQPNRPKVPEAAHEPNEYSSRTEHER
jgi:hypothetical protein